MYNPWEKKWQLCNIPAMRLVRGSGRGRDANAESFFRELLVLETITLSFSMISSSFFFSFSLPVVRVSFISFVAIVFCLFGCQFLVAAQPTGSCFVLFSRRKMDNDRVILENAAVRAAAVPALAKFAARLPSLAPSVRVLLKRSLLDEDDEVIHLYPSAG